MLKHNYDERSRFKIDCIFFSGQTHFKWECLGQISDSIKIAIFFARSTTRASTHEHEHCLCIQSLLKRKFLNNSP